MPVEVFTLVHQAYKLFLPDPSRQLGMSNLAQVTRGGLPGGSAGFQMSTGAPPNKPDFESYFGQPLREIKTNPYEACVARANQSRLYTARPLNNTFPTPTGMQEKTTRSQKHTTDPTHTSPGSSSNSSRKMTCGSPGSRSPSDSPKEKWKSRGTYGSSTTTAWTTSPKKASRDSSPAKSRKGEDTMYDTDSDLSSNTDS